MKRLSKITRHNIIYTVLLVFLLSVFCLFIPSIPSANAAEFDDLDGAIGESGVYINSSKVTRTFISLPLTELTCYAAKESFGLGTGWAKFRDLGFELSYFKRSQHNATLIIEFPDVKVPSGKFKGQSVLITCAVKVELPAGEFWGRDVKILSDIDNIYVYDSWYKLFTDPKYSNDFHNIRISLFGNGYAKPLLPEKKTKITDDYYFRLSNAKIYQEEVPSDIDDPDSEHYNPGGGLGAVIQPEATDKETFWDKIAVFWKALPKWLKVVVIAIPCLFVFGIIIKLIKWVVK